MSDTKRCLRIVHRHTSDDLLVLPLTDEQAMKLRGNMDHCDQDMDSLPETDEPLFRIEVWVGKAP